MAHNDHIHLAYKYILIFTILYSDPDYCYPALLTNPILSSDVVTSSSDEDGCFCLKPFASELRNPLLATHAGDGSHRLFVAEQIGVVWVFLQVQNVKCKCCHNFCRNIESRIIKHLIHRRQKI